MGGAGRAPGAAGLGSPKLPGASWAHALLAQRPLQPGGARQALCAAGLGSPKRLDALEGMYKRERGRLRALLGLAAPRLPGASRAPTLLVRCLLPPAVTRRVDAGTRRQVGASWAQVGPVHWRAPRPTDYMVGHTQAPCWAAGSGELELNETRAPLGSTALNCQAFEGGPNRRTAQRWPLAVAAAGQGPLGDHSPD